VRLSATATKKLHSLGFHNLSLYTPFTAAEWIKEIESLPDPTAYWPFHEGAGTAVEDIVGGYDLTMNNAAGWNTKGPPLSRHSLLCEETSGDYTTTYYASRSSTATYGSNIVTNGTMEADSDWTSEGSPTTQERSSTQAHGGTYSRTFTVGAQTEGIRTFGVLSMTKGKRYRLKFWVYPDDTTTVRYAIKSGNGSTWLAATDVSGLTQDSWNEVEVFFTETVGGTSGLVAFVSPIGQSSGTWYIDDVTIEPASFGGLDLGTVTKATWTFWMFPRSLGEGSASRLYSKANNCEIILQSTDEINFTLYDVGGADSSVTTSSPFSTFSRWYFAAFVYDGTQSAGSRKSVYVGDLSGALTLQTLGADAVEDLLVDNGNTAHWGDSSDNNRAFDGWIDQHSFWSGEAFTRNQLHLWQRLTGGIISGAAARY
jgi:hypothetical protein